MTIIGQPHCARLDLTRHETLYHTYRQDRFVTAVSSGFYHSIAITCKRSGEGPMGAARGLAADLLQLLDNERQSDVRCVGGNA